MFSRRLLSCQRRQLGLLVNRLSHPSASSTRTVSTQQCWCLQRQEEQRQSNRQQQMHHPLTHHSALWIGLRSESTASGMADQHQHFFTSRSVQKDLSLEEVKFHLNSGDTTIIDVREPDEFANGHIPGAINIPLNTLLSAELGEADEPHGSDADIVLPPKSSNVIVYCKAGVRSHVAQAYLHSKGWTNSFNFVGSWLAWKQDLAAQQTQGASTEPGKAHHRMFEDYVLREPATWGAVPVVSKFTADQWKLLLSLPLETVSNGTSPRDVLQDHEHPRLVLKEPNEDQTEAQLYFVCKDHDKDAWKVLRISTTNAKQVMEERRIAASA